MTDDWAIRVPASSANLGAGFDVLGMAVTLHAEIGVGAPPGGAITADDHHPAAVAYRALGGSDVPWVRSPIPMGRGLGFSGAVRVGGAVAALVQREGRGVLDDRDSLETVVTEVARLEGHADNAAASLHGGIVVVAGDVATQVPLAFDPAVVVWIPDDVTTSTDRSRTTLSETVLRSDAVFNLGRVGTFVATCARGDVAMLRRATEDRLHQSSRLAAVPATDAALRAGLEAGVWAAWLSGSGPAVAMLCESSRSDEVAAALPAGGHTKQLRIDHEGATVIDATDDEDDTVDTSTGTTDDPRS